MANVLDVIKEGDADKLSRLIQSGAFQDMSHMQDDMGRNPLILAAMKGHLMCLRILVESGYYRVLEERDRFGYSALFFSLACFNLDCFQYLSRIHCHDALKDIKKLKPIIEEIEHGRFERLSHLTAKSKIVRDMTKYAKAAFIFLLINHRCPRHLLSAFVNGLEDINPMYHFGMNFIIYATAVGNLEALEEFLSHDFDLSVCDNMGKSALIYAIEKDCVKSAQLIVDAFSNLTVLYQSLDMAIHVSLAKERHQCLGILLKTLRDKFDSTARLHKFLLHAAKEGNLPCLKILLDLGIDAALPNDLGETALMHAVIKNKFDCFEFLLERGAPFDAVDIDGETIFHHAVQWKRPMFVVRLLELGANINSLDTRNMTPISMACCQNDIEILEAIINSVTDLRNIQVNNHATAVQLAIKFCNIKALVLLMKNGIFRWSWLDNCHDMSPEVVATAAVTSNIRPGQFLLHTETMTLLKLAFYYRAEGTVRYLIANLYLSEYDKKYLSSDQVFIKSVKSAKTSNLKALLYQFLCEPWSLKSLCLLSISGALDSSMKARASMSQREDVARQLPIPESLQNKLIFKSNVSEVCVDKWHRIGVVPSDTNLYENRYVNLMSHVSPLWRGPLPPACELLGCYSPEKYRRRFETLRIKKLYG